MGQKVDERDEVIQSNQQVRVKNQPKQPVGPPKATSACCVGCPKSQLSFRVCIFRFESISTFAHLGTFSGLCVGYARVLVCRVVVVLVSACMRAVRV